MDLDGSDINKKKDILLAKTKSKSIKFLKGMNDINHKDKFPNSGY